ncbi:MAG TPA: NAD-dependent succinate-semialdehyde dehydrogenase, partial [Burkholderiales bacterium]|nr:NAD-dependent succinate-semialdehyde dehydrogenase [Burkholderiales bacterium]
MYPKVQLLIDGQWCDSASGDTLPVANPATGETIGTVARAGKADLDRALEAAAKGFQAWRKVGAFDRYKLMRKAADLLRSRAESIAPLMTQEQGKPLAEAKMEILAGADIIDWFAEEARRAYGRVIPPRAMGVYQLVIKEPVGPVAAFTPWNFPINQVVRKLSCAVAAGCSIIVKAPEETPASPAELLRVFVDAGAPAGVVNLVYGVPAEISEYLIPHPTIRKITFTGSTVVGKQLAALAGKHMKRCTMELGGHAPVIVFDDADVAVAAKVMAASKFRNAGQVCISPTRFLVQEGVYNRFVEKFVDATKALKVGNGMESGVQMGALANPRRATAMEANVEDASKHGGKVRTGGHRIGKDGNFWEPTVVTELPNDAKAMNDEPFGPLAVINPFKTFDEAVVEANRLPYGLAAYAWTRSAKTANAIAANVETG